MFLIESSPTVSIKSVLIVLGIITRFNWLIIVKIDLKRKFVKEPMTGDPVYMKIGPKLSKQIVEIFPE
jgi:hypothetical protein